MWRLQVRSHSGNCRKEKPFKRGFFLFIKNEKVIDKWFYRVIIHSKPTYEVGI